MQFREGEPALLIDSKGRRFLLKLEAGRSFQFHNGVVPHDELIGAEDGTWVVSFPDARASPPTSTTTPRMRAARTATRGTARVPVVWGIRVTP